MAVNDVKALIVRANDAIFRERARKRERERTRRSNFFCMSLDGSDMLDYEKLDVYRIAKTL